MEEGDAARTPHIENCLALVLKFAFLLFPLISIG